MPNDIFNSVQTKIYLKDRRFHDLGSKIWRYLLNENGRATFFNYYQVIQTRMLYDCLLGFEFFDTEK